jgi:hypothetical protein
MLDFANTHLDLARMTPQPGLASTTNCLARADATDAEYLVFAPSGGTFTVNLSATTNTLNVRWLNPSTGALTNAAAVAGGSSARAFTAPFSGDAVLHLVDAARPPVLTNIAYMDAGLAVTNDFSYRVRAIDADGNLSPYSSVVTLSLPVSPRITGVTLLDARHVRLNCSGPIFSSCRVEASPDALNWSTLASITTDGTGSFVIVDSGVDANSLRFYRIAVP